MQRLTCLSVTSTGQITQSSALNRLQSRVPLVKSLSILARGKRVVNAGRSKQKTSAGVCSMQCRTTLDRLRAWWLFLELGLDFLTRLVSRYMNAEKYGLDRIYFGGCFIRGEFRILRLYRYSSRCRTCNYHYYPFICYTVLEQG